MRYEYPIIFDLLHSSSNVTVLLQQCRQRKRVEKGGGDQEQLAGRPGITAEEICKNWNHFSNLGKQGAKL